MDRVRVRLGRYFAGVRSEYGHDPAAWQAALELAALGLARHLCGEAAPRPPGGRDSGEQPPAPGT